MSLVITLGLGGTDAGGIPTVTIISPPPGSDIAQTDPIVFEITGGAGIVGAIYAGALVYEFVHDGDNFAPLFAPLSTRTVISGGFRYTVERLGGWPGKVTLKFFGSVG